MSCGHEHSLHSPPPHTPTQAGLSPTRVQPGPAEPEQSPPPHSPVQDGTTETPLDRPCSPTNIIVITSPQQSPPRRRHSPMSHSSAHVGTSPRQNLTQDAEHTLDNESPAELQCGPAQHISTLDQGLSPVCYRSTQTARKHASLRPSSAPCSPSPSPLRATQCSLSQPASPSQAQSTQPLQLSILSSQLAKHSRVTNECTQTSTTELKSLEHSPMQLSPNLDDQTLESSPTSDLSTVPPDSNGTDGKLANQCIPIQSNPDFSSPHHSPSMPTPESLVHVSPSVEHSSLTCSPRADETEVIPPSAISICLSPSRDSPSCCTEATDGKASPTHTQNISASTSSKHTSQMSTSPASSIQACASSIPVDTSYIAAETSPSTQPASPSEVLAGSISCQDEDMEVHVDHPSHFIQSETSPKHPNSSSDSKVHGSPAHTEANGYSQMGSMHVQERASPSVCSFPELAQTQASLSPTHPGQSDPSPPCSPPQTSPDQTSPLQTSFSPPHCMLSGSSPESSSVSHSLSHSGQTSSHSASITDVTVSHSPPRSSPAGQASPFHIQSASSSPHSGPAQRQTPSLASTTYSSPAHAAATCVSPPHSPAQSIETYRSPTGSPAPDTAAQLSPTLASSNLDVDIIQSSVLPAVLHLDSGLVKPPDRIQQTSPAPAYDSHARSPNQASPSQVSQSPAGPLSTPDRSAAESQQSIASGSPLHRTPAPSVDASSTLASPVPSSPTQDTTAMPSTDHINETPSSPTPSAPSKASSVYSSPVASSVHDPGDTQVNSSLASPLRPDTSPSPGPGSPIRCEASSHSADAVSPVLATHVQSETSPSPGPVSPVQPGASPSRSVSSPQQHTTERASAFAEDVSMAEKQEQKTEEVEEVQGEVSQQEEEEVDDPHQRAEESPEEEEPAREQDQEEQEEISHQRAEETLEEEQPAETEGGGEQDQEEEQEEISHQRAEERLEEEEPAREQDQEEEEDQNGSSNCPSGSVLNEDPLSPPHSSAASLFLPQSAPPSPQPTTPHSALPPLQSSSPLPSPPRAGSLEASPLRTALLPSTPPSPPLEQEATCQSEAATKEVGLEDKPLSCHVTSAEDDSQSQSHFEPVAEVKEHFQAEKSEPVAAAKEQFEPTQHEHQSHAEPSERQEEPEPMREKQDAEEQDPSSSSLEDLPLEQEATCQSEAATGEAELEDKPFSCHVTSAEDEELVAEAKEPTKDEHQSHAEPTEREEEPEPEPRATATPELVAEQQPIREKQDTEEEEAREGGEQEDQSDVEQEDPVSPVLELDPSLDMEVMALLQLSSSSLTPLSRRVVGRTLRPTPPCSSRPSDDLSIRLRQSPFSTEASPETSPARAPVTPPPLSPPSPPYQESPPLSKPQTLPVTVLPLTPKIGMGKPAISKRKFSPGRARIKQGSWWSNRRAVSPPSSSQDSMGEGGWDSPKPRPPDSPLWSMRVSRGSGFPGRRRSRGGGLGGGRGGRGRSRLKTQDSLPVSPGSVYAEPFQPKEEEENSMHNTVVMFSTSDHFTLKQDMCVVCGSFGQGAEGRLLACSQCGQCYHPYCVNLKITRVVLTKGWRCLECTVCEACGEASDPGRLLLCDDCDISYHTYCLDPPLHTVPKGAWKCKWCVWCVQCGSASPGLRCDWQNNYSRCGPCASLSHCPLCQRQYSQDDLILQCQQCDRWVHAVCQGLNTEEEVEAAADEGFDCSLCRTHSRGSYGRSDSFDSPYMAQIISRIREPDTKTYTQDGVSLTESGLSHLQSLVEPLTSPRRYRRCKPKLKLRIINQNSVSVLQTPPDTDPPTQQDPSRGDVECEMKSDSSPERDHVHDDDITKEPEVTDDNKKRKRKPYRPGIGGFMVRQRGGKAGPSRIKLCRKDSVETLPGRDEDVSMETVPAADQTMEKAKKRYRKKKTKLEEEFPSYLQEAFFGRDLLDQSRQVDKRAPPEAPAASQSGAATPGLHGPSPPGLPLAAMVTNAFKKQGTLPMSEEALLDLSDVLNTDPHILATGHTAGLDISSMAADLTGSGRGQRTVQEEPLDAILSPELDKMVTDGAILSKLYNIPELEGKDVEEVFTAVLSPNSNNHQQPGQSQHAHTAAGSKGNTHHSATVFPRLPLMNGLMGAASHFSNPPMMPGVAQSPAGFRMPPPESPAPGLASANQAPAGEAEQDVMSTAQRGMLKWEKEESLGEMATVAPVLYCNTNFPQLKEQHPEWSTRVKQIAKLWRKASSQDRAPFVQKARDNRAAQRISRVQLSNDPLKRHPPSQPPSHPPSQQQQQQQHQLPLPPGPYDPVSMETEGAFRDPLRPRETEQEQEWKLRQGEVNDRWGAGMKRQENLPQSKALKSPTDKDCPYQASVAGGGKEALIMRQKSKQLAKMEATQKLEQVKSEQRQQQMLIGRLSPDGGSRSPGTPDAARDAQSRQLLLQSSGLADDVFLRPQAPPPSGFSPLPSSPLHQPPSSPQMFSPPSSRPSSPWDPYGKVVGTPRPASSQQQRHNSLSASPAHDAFSSPAPSPDAKTSDVSRSLAPQPGLQQSRTGMMSPPSGSAPDLSSRHVGIRAAETYQRTPLNSANLRVAPSEMYSQGGLFKAPMPPQQPEVFGGPGGVRRDPSRPSDQGFPLQQSQDAPFPSSPLSGLGSPHRSPYRQDYIQPIPDPFPQHSPLTSRPSPDPYANPQTPGTPRQHSDPAYLATTYNQQAANRRPSPSHPNLDPYTSNPGTPRPSGAERFPRSPGSQRGADPYAQQPSTPRPQKPPAESFTPQPAESGTFTPTLHQFTCLDFSSLQLQQSPGRQQQQQQQQQQHQQQQQQQQQDSFPRTPGSQTPKHAGMSEESVFLGGQTQGHDAFEQGHMTSGPSLTDKTTANEMAALGVASLDGPMSMLPQLGDSEEKLRQRQRLRQLILRQQQQKSALRQEKGLQEAASASAARHWAQVDPPTAPPADLFGRPPPPYPGTVRPVGGPAGFPAEQRGFGPRELGVRAPNLRFGVPPASLQDSFLRPPQGAVPGSGISSLEGVPAQMRRPMPGEFTGIRPLPAAGTQPHMMPGLQQPFPPRSFPLQQHSIMGQPYIELRHRIPENRLRLSFPLPAGPDPRDLRPCPPVAATLGQQSVLEQLNQQQLAHAATLSHALPGADGMEEHLEDSAVKDLEDVEVKDLVDLNLNLDPEDGKEDLDLGPNDLHLDDFLLSGKFDLIAYADPELNLEDKKDMFNEELELGETAEDRKTDSHFKQEVQDGVKTEARHTAPQPGVFTTIRPPGPLVAEAAGSLQKGDDSGSGSGALPTLQTQEQAPSSGMTPRVHPPMAGGPQSVFQQRPFGPSSLFTPHPQGLPLSLQPPQPRLLLNPQTQLSQPGGSTQTQTQTVFLQNQNQSQDPDPDQDPHRALLLEEQPLLLQDLLDQERQEQQQQKQMQALIRQRPPSDAVLPNMADFDSITDPIMKAKMVALKGINKVMTQGSLGLNPMAINRFQPAPVVPAPEGAPQPPQPVGQDGKLNPPLVRPSPPSFGPGFSNESQRRQYEEWLGETQQLLQMQQRLLEEQIAAHRKTKKSLSAKQRTAKKAGRALTEEDAAQLRNITEQQGTVQKQLEQIRKQQKDHAELIDDYRTKQQRAAAALPPLSQPPLSKPPLSQPHPCAPTLPRAPNVPLGWSPGGGAPGVMGQRMPLLPPPQMPPTAPPPPAMTPGLAAPTAGFPAGPRAPPAGSNGAAGDAAPQVKFDDNNPFSEGFQERERRERLREQQERQRVQLMHEVERHRALQQRLELEQQGMLGNSMPPSGALPGARVGQTPGPPATDTLSQMPFFSSELPQDFLQSPPPPRPAFPQPAALPPGFPGGRSPLETAPSSLQARPRLPAQGAVLPTGVAAAGTPPSHPRFGHDSSSSSPSFPGASLAQLYSDIIPDDKPKKKRSRKRDGDDSGAGARTPLSSHSDDITAPPTPARSDTSCSTPTRSSVDQSDVSFSLSSSLAALAPSSELERQLSAISAAQQRGSVLGTESQRGPLSAARLEVKEEREEGGACSGGGVKMEACGGDAVFSPSPPYGGDGGKELLRHLLKDKTSPATTPSPTGQAPPTARRQLSNDSVRSEDDDHGNMVTMGSPGADLLDASGRKKTPRCKRLSRPEKDKAPPKNKRRKKEEEEKTLQSSSTSSSDPLMTHLRQLSVLPLMEPVLGVDLSLFPPYGSSSLGRDSLLSGSFGNGCLDGVTDYYSQLIYKNNLSNPPTPPASLPPTPPPVARQKLVNGFATTDELARKDISEQDVNGVKQKGEELLALNHASKTVDVPASLPTPPHNNQEELRVQDASGRDSPDGFVPSSSPESVADMEVSRYPDLSFIKLEPPSPCPSPTIPMMPCAWGKGSAVKQEVKTEPNHQFPPSCSNTDLVTIAITLNPVAAQNVAGVMAAVAELLRVPVPADYQLSGAAGTERNSLALLAGVRVPLTQSPTVSRQQRPPQCCSCCKVLLGNGVRIVKELKQEGQSRPGSSLVFCSPNCSALYTSELQSRTSGNKAAVQAVQPGAEPPGRVQHRYSSNMSSIAVHSLLHAPSSSPRNSPAASPPLSFPPASAVTMETRPRVDSLKVKVKLKPRPRALPGGEDVMSSRPGKRMKNCRWRRWSFSITLSRGPCTPNEGHAMPTEEEVDVLLKNLGACLSPDASSKDQRRCCFCNQQGDGRTDGPARLLNLDLDLWVHLNCALWSSEVYETQAGALINVELALRRSLTLRCAHCQRTGATSGCNRLRCTNTYHFSCALQAHCTFFKDKTMLCPLHKPRTVPLSGDRSSSCSPSSAQSPAPDPAAAAFCDPYDCELRCFSVFRRVFVQRDEARQIAGVVQRGERQHTFRVGSLLFRAIGRLLPHQMKAFHNQAAIFPIGYHANRIYWSMRHSNRRCKYLCCIEEAEGRPLFRVKVVEKGYDDLVLTGPSPKAVWDQILEPVSQLRSSSGTLKLFPVYLKGEDLFGLTTSAVTRIIESLPGVETCERYIFRYGRNPLMEWPLAFNPSGSARSEPKACQTKRPTLLTSIAPRCQGSVGSIVGVVPGVIALSPGESVAGAHQGRHSKSAQYRRMKAEWKTNVYLARSRIQGLGLYAARDIEKCTMVIEYIGTIIRSEVANRKERLYESQNRGVYMFRIDNDFVIDATITGGPARYINHSCSPNCITEVVTVEKENKIIISSCRRIQRGEELSYDYKFDLEDDQHKIPCHCGAVNCRKWMN
ncbi:histone-lysine N-methyltransferase 2C-like isoform X2 [Sander vitreus]